VVFDYDEYLTQVAVHGQNHSDESFRRSAVSRAYYAAYHCATRALRSHGIKPHSHRMLWEDFDKSTDPAIRDIAKRGKKLKVRRESADYDCVATFPASVATGDVIKAQDLINGIVANQPNMGHLLVPTTPKEKLQNCRHWLFVRHSKAYNWELVLSLVPCATWVLGVRRLCLKLAKKNVGP